MLQKHIEHNGRFLLLRATPSPAQPHAAHGAEGVQGAIDADAYVARAHAHAVGDNGSDGTGANAAETRVRPLVPPVPVPSESPRQRERGGEGGAGRMAPQQPSCGGGGDEWSDSDDGLGEDDGEGGGLGWEEAGGEVLSPEVPAGVRNALVSGVNSMYGLRYSLDLSPVREVSRSLRRMKLPPASPPPHTLIPWWRHSAFTPTQSARCRKPTVADPACDPSDARGAAPV